MPTMAESVVTLKAKYQSYIPTKIRGIKVGVDSEEPALIVEASPTWSQLTESTAATLVPECGLNVGHEGHRVVVRKREVALGDSGIITPP